MYGTDTLLAPSFSGLFCQVVSQQCDLRFNLSVSNPNNIAQFIGLAASEKVAAGGNSTGSTLTCSCPTNPALPARWHGPPISAPSNESSQQAKSIFPVEKEVPVASGSLHINSMFICAEAGNYTCVIGNNTRQVLVLPVGKCNR